MYTVFKNWEAIVRYCLLNKKNFLSAKLKFKLLSAKLKYNYLLNWECQLPISYCLLNGGYL